MDRRTYNSPLKSQINNKYQSLYNKSNSPLLRSNSETFEVSTQLRLRNRRQKMK